MAVRARNQETINQHNNLCFSGYFLTRGLSGEAQAEIIKESILRLDEAGVTTEVVVGDGLSANLKMAQELGCDTNPESMRATFPDPSTEGHDIAFLLDACHMLKLARNTMASEETLQLPGGKVKTISLTENFQKKQLQLNAF